MKIDAKIICNNGEYEVRCARCGKLLLTYEKIQKEKSDITVDNSSRIGIMVTTRCTRNDCKADNQLVLS